MFSQNAGVNISWYMQ